jgi:hypothetical protein
MGEGFELESDARYERIGDTQSSQGDLAGALKSYRAALVIRQNLAAADPTNVQWQLDLLATLGKLGSLNAPPQRRADRRALLLAGLQLLESLLRQSRLSSRELQWKEAFGKTLKEL